jgi:TAT (twin-arginine translocation) pathway signal sequence
MAHHSRRSFLKTGAGAAGLCLVGPSALVSALSGEVHEPVSDKLTPFPLASVRLGPGIFKEQEEILGARISPSGKRSNNLSRSSSDTEPDRQPSADPSINFLWRTYTCLRVLGSPRTRL